MGLDRAFHRYETDAVDQLLFTRALEAEPPIRRDCGRGGIDGDGVWETWPRR